MKLLYSLHPAAVLPVILFTIILSMLNINPLFSACSLAGSLILIIAVSGVKELLKTLKFALPVFLLMSAVNPLLVRDGYTVLFTAAGIAFTLEAALYGISASMSVISVFCQFKCLNAVIDGDKFLYLFGNISPRLALTLSAAIGFYPTAKKIIRETDDCQRLTGIYSDKNFSDKIKAKGGTLSAATGLCLEKAMEKADMCRARGFSLKNRTHYSPYDWRLREWLFFTPAALLFVSSCVLLLAGGGKYDFYPLCTSLPSDPLSLSLYFCYSALLLTAPATETFHSLRVRRALAQTFG